MTGASEEDSGFGTLSILINATAMTKVPECPDDAMVVGALVRGGASGSGAGETPDDRQCAVCIAGENRDVPDAGVVQ